MFKEIFLSFKENIKQKTTNPFFGTLIFVWIIHNWELVYTFFNFEPTRTLNSRITYLDKHFSTIPFLENLLKCIGITFIVLILSFIFINISRFITNIFENKVTPWVYKITDKGSIVLKEDYKLLQTENNQLFKKVEEERAEKLKFQGEVTKLEEKISELLANENITIEDIIHSNEENSYDHSKQLNLILEDKNKKNVLEELIDSNNNDDWIVVDHENSKTINYFLRADIIQIKEKNPNSSRHRKYVFTDIGNIIQKEYLNKTLHNTG